MTGAITEASPPQSYREWLELFEVISAGSVNGALVGAALKGTPVSGGTLPYFCGELSKALEAALNRTIKRFTRELNELIEFGELYAVPTLFARFGRSVGLLVKLTELDFLGEEYGEGLARAVKKETKRIWDITVSFLKEQSERGKCDELEDALYLIGRIKLFR